MLNVIQGKVKKNPEHIGTGGKFLYLTPMANALRSTIDKWNPIGLKRFCNTKDTVNSTDWQSQIGKRLFTNPTSYRRLTSKIYKELKKLDSREPNNPINEWGTELKGEISTEES